MLMRAILTRLKCSATVSSQFIQSIPKNNPFSNVKNPKSTEHVSLRTFVSAVSEINKSSKVEQDDNKREVHNDMFYYNNYFSNNPQFSELLFREELKSESADSSLLLTTLRELNAKTEVVTTDLVCLIPHVESELPSLSLYELLEATNLTFGLIGRRDDMWAIFRNCFNKEFMSRRKSLSVNEMFMIFNVLTNLKIFRRFDFSHKALHKLVFKVDKLTHPQFVLFCHYLKILKYIVLDKFKFEFITLINGRIPSLNATELGLLSDAFSNTDLKLVSPLFENVMMKVLKDIENIDAPVIASICKNVARISRVEDLQLLIDFQEKLIKLVPKFNNVHLRSLLYSGISVRYLNMALYDEVMKRVKSDMANFYLADISGLAFLNTTYNIDDKEFLDMALNEFERRDSCLEEFVAYVKFLANLIHFQVYPKNLLEKVLSNDVFMKVMTYESGRLAWASVKWSLEIEKPEMKFPEVDAKLYAKLLKYMKYSVMHEKVGYYYQSKLHGLLETIYGKNFVCSRRVSFHQPNCSVLRLDKNFKVQEIPEEYKESKDNFRNRAPCDDHIWVCIFLLYKDCFTDLDGNIINYRTQTHLRQLSLLGYKNIFLRSTEWHPHLNKDPSSLTCLENLINEKLKELQEVQQNESEK